jgi:NAD(P)-dependent dehydrogenase (short-subunit alcohol dehydrogenase family)
MHDGCDSFAPAAYGEGNAMPQTVVITGASSGVGLAAAVQFAQRGDQVVVVGRNAGRLSAAVEAVRAAGGGREPGRFQADFERLADVRALAGYLREKYPAIDVLAANAGGMVKGYRRTADGFEATLQGNHLAPFLLANLVRDQLSGGRLVVTASDAHRRSNLNPDDLVGSAGSYSAWKSYGAAKSANILFAAEAARRWPDIFALSFHPGVVRTNFGTGPLIKFFYKYAPGLVTPEAAGAQLVWLATTPAAELTDGAYYVKHDVARPSGSAADPAVAARLWEASARAVDLQGTSREASE